MIKDGLETNGYTNEISYEIDQFNLFSLEY